MREGDAGRVDPFIIREDGGDDRRFLSMLFSDLGDFPPVERPLREQREGTVETAEAPVSKSPQATAGVAARNGDRAESHLAPNGSLSVKPQTVRPFIEEVFNVPTAPGDGRVSPGRWKVAALSVVGFFAVAGTAAATLSVGYQASARDRQVIPARAGVFPQLTDESGSTDAVDPGANLTGFQGCTKGEGLSPLGLMVVARDFVSTSTSPAVCLPAEAPRKKDGPGAKAKPPADQTTSTPIVGTTPSGSGFGGAPSPGSGSGGTPGTGGGGTDPAPTPPPPDGGTTDPDKPGNGWGKGGKPKGSATG